jgi:putative FmdB family regulatory protein
VPVYCYKCNECSHSFEARHSMSFESQQCNSCDSYDIFKVPSLSLAKSLPATNNRAGKVVDDYIRDVKQEIKEEKTKLKSEEL